MVAANGHAKCCTVLIQHGATIEYATPAGETALLRAARTTDERCVSMLLSAGARWDKTDADGRTVMHIAALFGNDQVILALLARQDIAKVLVNQQAAEKDRKRTPLCIASAHGWWKAVRNLALGCVEIDLEMKDMDGLDAKELAESTAKSCVEELVRAVDAREEGWLEGNVPSAAASLMMRQRSIGRRRGSLMRHASMGVEGIAE